MNMNTDCANADIFTGETYCETWADNQAQKAGFDSDEEFQAYCDEQEQANHE